MSIHRGVVTRVTALGAFVQVPQLGANYEFGPMPIPTGTVLNTGDNVAVGSVGNFKNDLIVLSGQTNSGPTLSVVDTSTVDLTLNTASFPYILSAAVIADSIPLTNLSDVVLTSPVTGQMLRFDGTNWVNVSSIDLPTSGTIKVTNGQITVIRAANSDIVLETRSSTDTQNRFQLTRQSILSWGVGGTTAPDTNLYRAAADTLGSDDQINSNRASTLLRGLSVQISGDTGFRAYLSAGGVLWLGDGGGTYDINLYRLSNGILATDMNVQLTDGTKSVNVGASGATGAFLAKLAATTSPLITSRVTTDTANRYQVNADGKIFWGSGAASVDTNLYRAAADQLQTDDTFSSFRVGARLRRNATQSLTTATTTLVSWDTSDSQTGGTFITVSGTTITIPTGMSGIYAITYLTVINGPGGTNNFVSLNVTTSILGVAPHYQQTFNNSTQYGLLSVTIPLNAGDTFTCDISQNSGGTLTMTGYLTITRLPVS